MRLPAARAALIPSRIVLTASSASRATRRALRRARRATSSERVIVLGDGIAAVCTGAPDFAGPWRPARGPAAVATSQCAAAAGGIGLAVLGVELGLEQGAQIGGAG